MSPEATPLQAATRDPCASQASHVIAALLRRREALQAGRGREDGRRLGVVVEGGAMRAVVSGGVLVGLHDAGLRDVFDVAYGSSAGAINLAYFLQGTGERAAGIYFDHAATLRFVNPLRVRQVIDLDYLFEEVIRPLFPLEAERLRAHPTELKVSVTDAVTGRNRLVSVREPGVDVLDVLRASSAVPFYHGRKVRLLEREYVDGLASQALPVEAALEDGCTDVVVILSARQDQGSGRPRRRGRHDVAWPERLMLRAHPVGFRRAYLTRRRRLRRALALASADPRVLVLEPTAGCLVPSRLCRDRDQLRAAFAMARRRAHELFGPPAR